MLQIIYIIIGFSALIGGANWLVNGSAALARKFGVAELAIGLTIVAFGTSAPELVVNIFASVSNQTDLVLGNIIGSNNFNIFVILGISGLIYPLRVQSSTAWKEIPISLLVTILVLMLLNNFYITADPQLGQADAIVLLGLFALFLYYVFRQMRQEQSGAAGSASPSAAKISGLIIGGLAGLIIGGQLVVTQSVILATKFGISEKIIGLTIVAAGTSLPELVTTVVAAFKRNSDIAIGNVIGSNIFNLLLVLPISALLHPLSVQGKYDHDILLVAAGSTFLFVAMLAGVRKRLDRWEALILLLSYIVYTTYFVL
jgi:cation:H+ antiporter